MLRPRARAIATTAGGIPEQGVIRQGSRWRTADMRGTGQRSRIIQQPASYWWPFLREGFSVATQITETLVAMPVVLNHRLGVLGAMLRDPAAGNHAEVNRMYSEKVEVAMLMAASIGRDGKGMQAALFTVPGSVCESFAASMRIGLLSLQAGGRALAPVHVRVVANAKRLGTARPS